jgi:BCCT family betaine/carnitine transporter
MSVSIDKPNSDKIGKDEPSIHVPLFLSSVIFTLGLGILFSISPKGSIQAINQIKSFLMNSLGSVFLLVSLGIVFIVFFFACSKIGNVKFGTETDKPEYSTSSWLAMIFTGGCGSSMLYWGTIEWTYYFKGGAGNTPLFLAPGSPETAEWAMAYGLFHSGITPWSFYALVAVCVAYVYYVRKVPVFRISEICRPVLGKYTNGPIGQFFDYSYIFALLAGGATSLTFIANMVNGFLFQLLDIQFSESVKILIIAVFALATALIISTKLSDGLKKIANVNLYLLYGTVIFVILIGPTQFLFDTTTSSLGILLTNFFRMSLWTDSIHADGFSQDWTIFYWAWWLIYAPTMGIFLAKISKGRTIRQTIFAILGAGSLGCWVLYLAFGNYGMFLELNGIYAATTDILNGTDGGLVLAKIFSFMPFQWVLVPLMILLILIFSLTSLVSGAYSLAAVTTLNLPENKEPALWNRIFWSILRPSLTIGFIYLNSLVALKNSAIIASVPCLILIVIMVISMFKMLKEDKVIQSEVIIVKY